MPIRRLPIYFLIIVAACDHGIVPPEAPTTGVLVASIQYAGHPESWPPDEMIYDLRFVAMRFVPQDTTDFLQINRLVFSERLKERVPEQTVVLTGVETGAFPYSGVAQKYGPDTFNWRPVGLVEENDGFFVVASEETTHVSVIVDFRNPPQFPPVAE